MKTLKRVVAIVLVLVILAVIWATIRRVSIMRAQRAKGMVMGVMEYPVDVYKARVVEANDTISLPGSVSAILQTKVSSKVSGRVMKVLVKEGDFVSKGQLLAQIDTSDIINQVNQAKAVLQSAQTRYEQAQTAYELQKQQVQYSIQQAEATLNAARENLLMLKTGARPQEIKQVEALLAQAQANLTNAESNYQRTKTLYSQGAVAKQALDLAQMQYDVAKAQVESAKQQLELVKIGPREEQIRIAEQNVRQAEAMYELAKASEQQVRIRQQDMETAKAAVDQAKAAYNLALNSLKEANITSPTSGYVLSKLVDIGEIVAPGIPLFVIVNTSSSYVDCIASELDVSRLRVGQEVDLLFDAMPERTFKQRISVISPAGDPTSRSFLVRITLPQTPFMLKPGMFARARVIVGKKSGIFLPQSCVYLEGNESYVSVVENGKAVKKKVKTGASIGDLIEILEGVKEGEEVIERGDAVPVGAKVSIREVKEASIKEGAYMIAP
jgi:RND family efflux transporter MFP subunit